MSFTHANQPTLPRIVPLGLGLVLACGMGLIFHMVWYTSLAANKTNDSKRIEQIQQGLAGSAGVREEFRVQSERLAALKRQLQSLRQAALETLNQNELMAGITGIAEREQITLVDLRPSAERKTATHSEFDVNVKCVGEYAALCRFVSEMEALPGIHEVRHAEIQSEPGFRKYPLEVRVTSFYGLKPNAAPPAAQANPVSVNGNISGNASATRERNARS